MNQQYVYNLKCPNRFHLTTYNLYIHLLNTPCTIGNQEEMLPRIRLYHIVNIDRTKRGVRGRDRVVLEVQGRYQTRGGERVVLEVQGKYQTMVTLQSSQDK